MRVSLLTSFLLLCESVLAQRPNSFDLPFTQTGNTLIAGQSYLLTWSNIQGTTVSLRLRYGDPSNLAPGTGIVSGLANTGFYTYIIPASTTPMSDYAIEIVDEQNDAITNYSPLFTIEAPKVSSSTLSSLTISVSSPLIPSIPSSFFSSSSSTAVSTTSSQTFMSITSTSASTSSIASTTSSASTTTLMGTRLQTTTTMKAAGPTAGSDSLPKMIALVAAQVLLAL